MSFKSIFRTGIKEILDPGTFLIDSSTGMLQTNDTLGRFIDGYFTLVVKASNGVNDMKNGDFATLKIYVLQDTELMKFVFDLDPSSVQRKLPEFEEELTEHFPQPLKFHIYDTEFYSKVDGSLDFGRTSSCFQIVEDEAVIDLEKSTELLDYSTKPHLKRFLDKFGIVDIERCAQIQTTTRADWVAVSLVAIGALIGFLTIVASFAVCCLYSK